ncbi:MAG: hypothetical protein HOL93_00325 [Candidatus Marinimicrobia bacterium]|jgi:DNA-binding beta-propeller fold protein YncE|nr:hypothetical protein [Candidatus Neomarinimicrobiota bacterium]
MKDITTDGTNLYVADTGNFKIRKIVISTKVVSRVAVGNEGFENNDNGLNAEFQAPYAITTDGAYLYVGEHDNERIRKIE